MPGQIVTHGYAVNSQTTTLYSVTANYSLKVLALAFCVSGVALASTAKIQLHNAGDLLFAVLHDASYPAGAQVHSGRLPVNEPALIPGGWSIKLVTTGTITLFALLHGQEIQL